jgi:hypothetical protein
MAKTILIPIDFRTESLHTLKIALEAHTIEPTKIVLMYAESLGDSITELLFYTPGKSITNLTTPEFTEALEIIKNRFEGMITSISIKAFHGLNTNALKSFCEANNIDAIYIPKTYKLKTPKRAFNPIPLLRKLNLSVIEIA